MTPWRRGAPARLEHRIIMLIAAVTLLVALAGGLASVLLTQSVMHASIDEQLRTALSHRHASIDDLAEELPAGSVVLRSEGGRIVARGVGDDRAVAPADLAILRRVAQGPEGMCTVKLPERDDMRVLVKNRGSYRTLVAMSREGTERDIGRLAALELVCWILGGSIAVVVGVALARRLVRPLAEITTTAQAIAAAPHERVTHAVARRVPVREGATAEVLAVGEALNGMLEQVEAALQRRDESQQALRRFLADVSHELRTPIAVVRSHAELSSGILQRYGDALRPVWPGDPEAPASTGEVSAMLTRLSRLQEAGEQLPKSLRRIDAESLRMGRLVDDLLVLARLDGEAPSAMDDIDVTFLAVETLSDAKLLAPDHRWAFHADDVPVEIVANEDAVRRVILNLVSNARRHTPAGTAVSVDVRERAGGVAVVVADDGPGLPERVAQAPGQRFVGRDHADAQSTGLGLAITVSLVESMGGTITFDTGDQGTAVTVWLPRRPVSG